LPSTATSFSVRDISYAIVAMGVLVETLLERGAESDVAEAEAAIERLAATPADEGLVVREVWLLWLRALLAHAKGNDAAYPATPSYFTVEFKGLRVTGDGRHWVVLKHDAVRATPADPRLCFTVASLLLNLRKRPETAGYRL
jgi:hypothetical protein